MLRGELLTQYRQRLAIAAGLVGVGARERVEQCLRVSGSLLAGREVRVELSRAGGEQLSKQFVERLQLADRLLAQCLNRGGSVHERRDV